jgi:dihydrofolate reductase
MNLSLIVAMSCDGIIGRDGALPWRLPNDLRRFKRLTMGHPVIMGRKTFESIGRVLPGRTSIVVTRQPDYRPAGVLVAHSMDEALDMASSSDEAFVIGGGQIYAAALARVDRMYVTEVQGEVAGDTFFPDWDRAGWQSEEQGWQPADEKHTHAARFLVYNRIGRVDDRHLRATTFTVG